jgi:hypothetical protein
MRHSLTMGAISPDSAYVIVRQATRLRDLYWFGTGLGVV